MPIRGPEDAKDRRPFRAVAKLRTSASSLPTVDSARVRTLTTEGGDGPACARLMRFVQETDSVLAGPGMRLTFFEVGRQYYVVGVRADWVDPPPPGIVRLRRGDPPVVLAPRSWLLRDGWKRAGTIANE